MKYTLLEMIQRILSAIKGEEVNSYSDTAESLAVRDIVKECYFNIISNQDFPELKTFFELNASGDNNLPVRMSIPDDVIGVEWIRYNGEVLSYLEPDDFYTKQNNLDTTADNVGTMNIETGTGPDTIPFNYTNDADPQYYTYYEDKYIIFDSYDSDTEATLQKANTVCYGLRTIAWEDDDSFTPTLDAHSFNILMKDAKAMAFLELRQMTNQSEIAAGRKARIKAEQKKHRANYKRMEYYYNDYPNYGKR